MEVAIKPVCVGEGCGTKLRTRNVERGTCDRCDGKGTERKQAPKASVDDACPTGHVYARTGYTRKRTCFECAASRSHNPPTARFFVLHGLKRAKGTAVLSKVARKAGVSQGTLSEYAYVGTMAPEGRVAKIAAALGVSEDELKGVG